MNTNSTALASAPVPLVKRDPNSPAIKITGRDSAVIKAGTIFAGRTFDIDTPVSLPAAGLKPGADYAIIVSGGEVLLALTTLPLSESVLGGFHFAPGGNAPARSGGDVQPAINPLSVWDVAFRPACPDPRGMTLVTLRDGRQFWADIYLLGVDHLGQGTSALGATIADGDDPPLKLDGSGGAFGRLDYATAQAVMAHHGKGLLSVEEFFAAAYGVTEKSARDGKPVTTQLDAPRTSAAGLMQATGNMWVWGHDGDPDNPRASLFGGSWFSGDLAGSRTASVAYTWPGTSNGHLGARGRSDHLQLG